MTILLLIRHGENDVMQHRLAGRTPGVSLNDTGRQQAGQLAQALKDAPIRAVYSSPLDRAVETAAPIANSHGLVLQIRPALIEVNYGRWQGRTYKQLSRLKLWRSIRERPSQVRFPEGETLSEVQQRVVAELDGLVREWQPSSEPEPQPEAVIAVVSHADIIRLALAHYLNLALDDYTRLMVAPAAISMVQHDGLNRPRVISINQAAIFSWPEQISIKPGKGEKQRTRSRRGGG